MKLNIPNTNIYLQPGQVVKLGRFDDDRWVVEYGWFSFGGNRPFCGWYLESVDDDRIKPLQLPDLDDIYVIESGYVHEDVR